MKAEKKMIIYTIVDYSKTEIGVKELDTKKGVVFTTPFITPTDYLTSRVFFAMFTPDLV